MLFSSFLFIWIFLPVVWTGNFFLHKFAGLRASNFFLLAASLFFYAWGEPVYVLLMLFSITVNWALGRLLKVSRRHRKTVLAAAIIINLLVLGYYKYAGLIADTFNQLTGMQINVPDIALPIGISFFTFQALSYVIDVYRGECEAQSNWFKLGLYISFFPQLIAGPIVKYRDINAQIDSRRPALLQTASGIRRFCYGFSKKILIANVMGQCADAIYGAELEQLSPVLIWIASIAYTLQIYYDFSGYSDMAIGLGKMFGFTFKENFNYPYGAVSIRDFWRKWHISLSSWFRDYLYIPLGGSRGSAIKTYVNLLIVFFCTGIWHGASWNFVLWGLFHGCFCLLERIGQKYAVSGSRLLRHIYVLLVVNTGFVFFRIEEIHLAFKYLKRMFLPWLYAGPVTSVWQFLSPHVICVMAAGIIGTGMLQHAGKKYAADTKWKYSFGEMLFCTVMFIYAITCLAGDTYNPFIYFRF